MHSHLIVWLAIFLPQLVPVQALCQETGEDAATHQRPASSPEAPQLPAFKTHESAPPQKGADRKELEDELSRAAAADAKSRALSGETLDPAVLAEQTSEPGHARLGQEPIGNESNPAISLILDLVGASFDRGQRIHLGGHAPTSSGVAVTGAELAASANVDPYFKLDLALCFAHMHLEEIYLTSLSLPWNLQVRAGQFLSRVGRHNPTHPHSWHFVLHPLANQFLFGAEGLGAPGLELSWLAPLPWYAELSGALQVGGGGAFRTKPFSEGDPTLGDFYYPVRLAQFFDLSDDWALQVGANAVLGPSAIGPEAGNRSYAYGVDLLIKWRPIGQGTTGHTRVEWLTEAWSREMEVPHDLWRDAGGYSDLILGLGKRWELGVRAELWRRIQGGSPGSENSRGTFGIDTERASAAVSMLPSHFSRIRLQYTFERVEGYDPNHILLVQLEVSAGAHGAHAY